MSDAAESTMPNPEPVTPTTADPARAQRKSVVLFRAFVLLYAVVIAALAYAGHFGFLWKTIIVPTLFAFAALSGRFRPFVREWGPFLAALMLFDAVRGLIFALVSGYDLPFYATYVIDAERALLGGVTLPDWLQANFLPERPGLFEKLLIVIHGSHFLVFLLFGFLIWLVRPLAFDRFKLGMLLLIGGGLLVYLLVPTVPPWMAHKAFALIPPVRSVSGEVYNLQIPSLRASFDVNPIAAMPSLHTAFPAYLSLVAFRHFGRRGLWVAGYFALVVTCITYLGEHYVLDVLAGMALAAAAFFLSHRKPRSAANDVVSPAPAGTPVSVTTALSLRRPLLVAALLIVGTEGVRLATREMREPNFVNEAFVERELVGRSPLASFYAGSLALDRGDARRAGPLLERAMTEAPFESFRGVAAQRFARAALLNGDAPRALAALDLLPRDLLAPKTLALRAQVLLRLGREHEADAAMEELTRRARSDHEAAYELALTTHELGQGKKRELEAVAERLAGLGREPWARRASELRSLASRANP